MSSARANLQKGIKDTKEACKKRIEDHTTHNDLQRMWQGVQHITNNKVAQRALWRPTPD